MPTLVRETEKQRHTWLDALRGLALLNMIAYHASWDIVYLLGVDWPSAGRSFCCLAFVGASAAAGCITARRSLPAACW